MPPSICPSITSSFCTVTVTYICTVTFLENNSFSFRILWYFQHLKKVSWENIEKFPFTYWLNGSFSCHVFFVFYAISNIFRKQIMMAGDLGWPSCLVWNVFEDTLFLLIAYAIMHGRCMACKPYMPGGIPNVPGNISTGS